MKKNLRDEKELEKELEREKKEKQYGSPDAASNRKSEKADNWDEREEEGAERLEKIRREKKLP